MESFKNNHVYDQMYIGKKEFIEFLQFNEYKVKLEKKECIHESCFSQRRFIETNKCLTKYEKYKQIFFEKLLHKLIKIKHGNILSYEHSTHSNILYFLYIHEETNEILGANKSYDISKTSGYDWEKSHTMLKAKPLNSIINGKIKTEGQLYCKRIVDKKMVNFNYPCIDFISKQEFIGKDTFMGFISSDDFNEKPEKQEYITDFCIGHNIFYGAKKIFTEHEEYIQECNIKLLDELRKLENLHVMVYVYSAYSNIQYFLFVNEKTQQIIGAVMGYRNYKTEDKAWDESWNEPDFDLQHIEPVDNENKDFCLYYIRTIDKKLIDFTHPDINFINKSMFIGKDAFIEFIDSSDYRIDLDKKINVSDLILETNKFLTTNKFQTKHEKYVQEFYQELLDELQKINVGKVMVYVYSTHSNVFYYLYAHEETQKIIGAVKGYDRSKTSDEDWGRIWGQPLDH